MDKNEFTINFTAIVLGLCVVLSLSLFCLFCVNALAEEPAASEQITLSAVVKAEDGNPSKGAKIQLFVWENGEWSDAEYVKTDKDGIALFQNKIEKNKCYKFVELKPGSNGKLPETDERTRFAYVDSSGMIRYSKGFFEESSSLGDNPTAWPIPIVNK